jgi:beta-phosphoglucomutase
LPGKKELLDELRANEIKIGLASASRNAPAIIEVLGIKKYINYIVDPSKIKKGKPSPDIFLAAAKFLDVEPQLCVGIEDAEAGIEAIKVAGMFAVGVGSYESMKKADLIVENTEKLKFAYIQNQFKKSKSAVFDKV